MRGEAKGLILAGPPLPELNIKEYPANGWKDWLTLFRRHVGPSFKHLSNKKKVSTLLAKLGPDASYIFESFNVNGEVPFNDLLNLFEEYFTTMKARLTFYRRLQRADEDFEHFADALSILSIFCRFGPSQGAIVRDVFVLNLHKRYFAIQEKLLKEKDPTLSELIIMCKRLSIEIGRNLPFHENTGSIFDSCPPESLPSKIEFELKNERIPVEELKSPQTYYLSDDCSTSLSSLSHSSSSHCADEEQPKNSAEVHDQTEEKENVDLNMIPVGESTPEAPHHKVPNEGPDSCTSSDLAVVADTKTEKVAVLSNIYQRKAPSKGNLLDKNEVHIDLGAKTMDLHLNIDNEKNTNSLLKPDSNGLSKTTGVGSRLSRYSSHGQDQQIESVKTNSVSLSQFMKQCEELSLSNSAMIENKAKYLASGTVSRCQIDPTKSKATEKKAANGTMIVSKKVATVSTMLKLDGNYKECLPKAPISMTCFTEVAVVYIPEESDYVFVCPTTEIPFMHRLEANLKTCVAELENVDLPQSGKMYAAPWGDEWYRGQVVETHGETARVIFCDYGNEEDVPFSMLKQLPEEYKNVVPLAFSMRPPKHCPNIAFGEKLEIRPVSFTAGAWVVEVKMS